MASKTKTSKATKKSFSLAHMLSFVNIVGNQEYVLEPPHYEEKLRIYNSQVIIPYSISENTHDSWVQCVIPQWILLSLGIFPTFHRTKPIVSIKEPLNLEYMTPNLRVFHSAPSTKMHEDYIL